MNLFDIKFLCLTSSYTIEGRLQVTFRWRTNLSIGVYFIHLVWWRWRPRFGFCVFLDISFMVSINHETRPKKGYGIPNKANLTEWERNPESHVFVGLRLLALGVES